MMSGASSSGGVDEADVGPSKIIIPHDDTNSTNHLHSTDSTPPPSKRSTSWSQAPNPPRWRFIADAKKTAGYNSTAAGTFIPGLSAEELAAKYSAPEWKETGGVKEGVDVGKLRPRSHEESVENALVDVGKLDVEECVDTLKETIVGNVRRLGQRQDDAEEIETDVMEKEQLITASISEDKVIVTEENSMEAKENPQKNEEEMTTIQPTMQIKQCEEQPDHDTIVDGRAEEKEQPLVHNCAKLKEESSIQQSIAEPQQETAFRRRQCLLLLALFVIIAAIIGIVFGSRSINASSGIDSTTQFTWSRCQANEKYFSLQHYVQPTLSTDTTKRNIKTTSISSYFTWSLKESCSGEVLMKCVPCLFSEEGDIQFEFIENKRIGSPNLEDEAVRRILNENDRRGLCVPDDREYIFEVRKTNGSDEDRCCDFDVTTFVVTFDNATVLDSTQTNMDIDDGAVSTLFGDEAAERCPTDSPSTLVPPVSSCIATGEDLNLCLALDMSGSLCNRGTGYKCEGCIPESICNKDGVEIRTCCGNFHNVKEFAKRLISVFETIPSQKSYSIVGFATNVSFVSDLLLVSSDAFGSLDSLDYTGGATHHADAISSCHQALLNADVLERKSLIILITDGNPTEPEASAIEDSLSAAIQAKEAGVILIPVMLTEASFDNNTSDYISQLSSDGLFLNTSLSALDSLEENLLAKLSC